MSQHHIAYSKIRRQRTPQRSANRLKSETMETLVHLGHSKYLPRCGFVQIVLFDMQDSCFKKLTEQVIIPGSIQASTDGLD